MNQLKPEPDQSLNDFATIFANMWYRDFPLHYSFRNQAQRADWTTHIGITVRSTADLMGLFTHFECGERTDAILKDNQGNGVAPLEWEWNRLDGGIASALVGFDVLIGLDVLADCLLLFDGRARTLTIAF